MPRRPETQAPSPLAGRRILVVEDEYFLAVDIAEAIRNAGGHVVGPVGAVTDALEMLGGAERIDGAVVDINLRGEMAYPLADRLRERDVPFVFATGYDEAAIPPSYKDVRRWEKPFDASVLASIL